MINPEKYFATLPTVITGPGNYRTRSGEVVIITRLRQARRHGFNCIGRYPSGVIDAWPKTGRLYFNITSDNDIVEPVPVPITQGGFPKDGSRFQTGHYETNPDGWHWFCAEWDNGRIEFGDLIATPGFPTVIGRRTDSFLIPITHWLPAEANTVNLSPPPWEER